VGCPSKQADARDMRNITETTGGFLSNQPIYTYSIQSSDVNNSAADAHISQENVTFADSDSGKIMEMPLTIDQCQIDDSSSVELGAFLSTSVDTNFYLARRVCFIGRI